MSEKHFDCKLDKIIVPDVKIRKAQKDHERYASTKRNIKLYGVQQEIFLTDVINEETGKVVPDMYTLLDGLQRTSISKELGLETIPAKFRPGIKKDEFLILQMSLNEHRIPQKPKEKLQNLKRLMVIHPEWTVKQLSEATSDEPNKVTRLMKLGDLTPEALELVDMGKMKLTHAVALAMIPKDYQNKYLAKAMDTAADVWTLEAQEIKKAIQKANKEGRVVEENIITPHPLKRTELVLIWETLQHEFETANVGDKIAYAEATARLNLIKTILQVDDITLSRKAAEKEERKVIAAKIRSDKKSAEAAAAEQEVLSRRKQHAALVEGLS